MNARQTSDITFHGGVLETQLQHSNAHITPSFLLNARVNNSDALAERISFFETSVETTLRYELPL